MSMDLSMALCRRFARAVRSADRGREAAESLRPVGVLGILRSGPPLPLAIYVASRENLLVDAGEVGFAILHPPYGTVRRRVWQDTTSLAVLRLIDRAWDVLVFLGVGLLLLTIAAGFVMAFALTGQPGLALAAGGAALAAMAWVVVVMATGLVLTVYRAVAKPRRRPDQVAVAMMPEQMWTAAPFHVRDPSAAPALIAHIRRHLHGYLLDLGRELTASAEVVHTRVQGSPVLLIPRRGITSEAVRARLTEASNRALGPDSEVFVIDGDNRPQEAVQPTVSPRFFFWYLSAVATALALCAYAVAMVERRACAAATCAGHPTTYTEALRWLLQRLWFTDPPGLAPATLPGVVTGWLFSAVSAVGLLVAIVAIVQTYQRNAAVKARLAIEKTRTRPDPEVVILTAIETEYLAVREHLKDPAEREVSGTTYEIGTYTGDHYVWTVALGQIGPGGERAALQVERAYAAFQPTYLLYVGVAGGRKDVRLGDVVLAESVYDYQSAREEDGRTLPRFKTYHSSLSLIQRGQLVARQGRWVTGVLPKPPEVPPTVFIKPIAAGGRLIADRRSITATLIAEHCGDAVAVEMEGFGFLFGAHANQSAAAAVICGISDMLTGKQEASDRHWQPIAARNAAAFAMALMSGLRR